MLCGSQHALLPPACFVAMRHHAPENGAWVLLTQASLIAEELLKSEPETVRVLYNKFGSAVSFKPTVATVLMPQVCPLLRMDAQPACYAHAWLNTAAFSRVGRLMAACYATVSTHLHTTTDILFLYFGGARQLRSR